MSAKKQGKKKIETPPSEMEEEDSEDMEEDL
jgi:hypothetical protein